MPPDLQKEVGDFVDFLRQKYPLSQVKSQRTVGEYRQQIVMHDDFDQALDKEKPLFDQLRLDSNFSNEEVDLLFKRDKADTARDIDL